MPVLRAAKAPNESFLQTNRCAGHSADFSPSTKHIKIGDFLFTISLTDEVEQGTVGFAAHHRRWAMIPLNSVDVQPVRYDAQTLARGDMYAGTVTLEVDMKKARPTPLVVDTVQLQALVLPILSNKVLSIGEPLLFDFEHLGGKFKMNVTDLTTVDPASAIVEKKLNESTGHKDALVYSQTVFKFRRADGGNVTLEGAAASYTKPAIIDPDWNFEGLGIGGLDTEFSTIFRRAFASRVFPPELIHRIGMSHVKGILLYGPPGTGKTLMARNIGKMLNAAEPKIVNGPEILNKFVGQAEENIRNLFKDAEAEYKAKGENSQLHLIIFDEIDSICKQRGSVNSGSGVHDTVVNQLLSKMDGYDEMNNVLIIGMTNRKDMIDEALLRPGRLEVQMEISLPNEEGRNQILKIHTSKMRDNKCIGKDVDLAEISKETKNFSGAELAGLIRSATSFALNRHVNPTELGGASEVDNVVVEREDFFRALDEVPARYGTDEDRFEQAIPNGIINWGTSVNKFLENGRLFVEQTRSSTITPLVSVLVTGDVGSGKTALAARLAKDSGFPFIKIISPEDVIGMSDHQRCHSINQVFEDAYKTPLSIIVLDDIERLLGFTRVGPHFSNQVLQTLLILLKKAPPKGRKLLILGTTLDNHFVLEELGVREAFNSSLKIGNITRPDELTAVFQSLDLFDEEESLKIVQQLAPVLPVSIPVRRLIMLAETARQDKTNGIAKFTEMIKEFFA